MYLVHIKQVSSGTVRRDGPHKGKWGDDANDFWWTDGNAACDCNRAIFWACAAGEEAPDTECGTDAYLIRVTDEDGTVLYDEFEGALAASGSPLSQESKQ